MQKNESLKSNGVDRVRSSQNTPTRLRGTNFCTSSAGFAPSFVRQPNGPECTQIERNAPKCQLRVQCGGSGAFVEKNSDATSWHELLQPNGPRCTQIVRHAPKCQLRVQWDGSSVFVAKIPTRHPGTNFGTSSARFAPSFIRQPSGPKCTRIVRNAPKCHFRV